MIQLNSTFFVPVDKLEDAIDWLAVNYVTALRDASADKGVMLGQLLTNVEEDHIGLTVTSRFADETSAGEWDAVDGVALRNAMGRKLGIVHLLHFTSMIDIIAS